MMLFIGVSRETHLYVLRAPLKILIFLSNTKKKHTNSKNATHSVQVTAKAIQKLYFTDW